MLKELANAVNVANSLNTRLGGSPMPEDMEARIKYWVAGIFRLVVAGEIKKGKSSFINALLGKEDLVPTSADVATSTLFKIHYAERLIYRVFFRREQDRQPLEIKPEEVELYGTERGNPNNEKGVDFIEIGVPAPLLQTGLVIFDTPGLGGIIHEHRRITYECLPKADAVFFVTDSVDSPIGKLETDYLKDISPITKNIYFVQTKCCAVNQDARIARKNSNLQTLAGCLGFPANRLPYFLVDSQLRFEADRYHDLDDLKASGYPALLAFVQNDLLAKQEELLGDRIRLCAAPLVRELERRMNERKEILAADSAQRRQALEAELTASRQELQEWQEKEQPLLLTQLREKMSRMGEEAIDLCDRNKPLGDLHLNLNRQIEAATTKEELQAVLSQIHNKLPEAASVCMNEISERIRQEASAVLCELAGMNSLEIRRSTQLNVTTEPLLGTINTLEEGDVFTSLKTSMYGATAGLTIAAVAGGVIGSVVPVVGTIIGSNLGAAIAAFWGGYKASSYKLSQELKAAKQQAMAAMSQIISAMYAEMTKTVRRITEDINTQVSQAVMAHAQARSKELAEQARLLSERKNMAESELMKKQQELASIQREYGLVKRTLVASDRRAQVD